MVLKLKSWALPKHRAHFAFCTIKYFCDGLNENCPPVSRVFEQWVALCGVV